jgi:hypothetical protein
VYLVAAFGESAEIFCGVSMIITRNLSESTPCSKTQCFWQSGQLFYADSNLGRAQSIRDKDEGSFFGNEDDYV